MKLLVVVPGIGPEHLLHKVEILGGNLELIRESFSGQVQALIFNYGTEPLGPLEGDPGVTVIKRPGIVGQFIWTDLGPDSTAQWDFVIVLLDDVQILRPFNLDWLVSVYRHLDLDILSPSLSPDSRWSHQFMLWTELMVGKTRVVNFCEFFFFLMDREALTRWWSLFDSETRWLWGLDAALYLQGFKMAIVNDFRVRHWYGGKSYAKHPLCCPREELSRCAAKWGSVGVQRDLERLGTGGPC